MPNPKKLALTRVNNSAPSSWYKYETPYSQMILDVGLLLLGPLQKSDNPSQVA